MCFKIWLRFIYEMDFRISWKSIFTNIVYEIVIFVSDEHSEKGTAIVFMLFSINVFNILIIYGSSILFLQIHVFLI